MAKQVEELEKEKKELQVRLKAQEKKVDHLERAKRLEEIPLLKLQFEEFKEEAKVVWEEQEKDRIEGEKKQRASDVENRNRLVRMKTDKEKYLESLLKERKNIFEKKIAEFDQKVAEERKTRLERRKEERIEERRRKWMREKEEEEQRITEAYHQSKVRDHQRLLARHGIIEERKEWLEKYNNAQQEAAIESKRKEMEKQKLEEAKRLQIEREERERQRKENEIKDIQAKHTRDKIAQLANTEIGQKVLDGMKAEDIAKTDADEIMAKQVEELEKEKKELQVRLKAQEKKVDHLERAKRLEEIPLLKLQFEEFKEEAKVVWEEQEKDRIEGEKKQRASDVENRDRMVRMRDDKDKYLESLLKERKNVFEKKIAEFNVLVAEERKIRLERRKDERQEERRRKWMREREEEEQRRRDELAIKEKEEREAR